MSLEQQPDGTWVDSSGAPINDFPGAQGAPVEGGQPGGAFKPPSGTPDPANPGYDTTGYLLGSTYDPKTGQLSIPNSKTGQTSAYTVNPTTGSIGPPQQSFEDAANALNTNPLTSPWTVPFSYADFQGPTYTAPTINDLYNSPGYKARLAAGLTSMEKGAASRGNLLTGGTVRDENQAAQDYASNEWGNLNQQQLANFGTTYNSALMDWTTNYNKALQGYQQAYNIFSNNQANQFNRTAAVAGFGQTAANQLGSSGLGYAGLNANTNANGANTIGGFYTQAGNANAAGSVGSANAWNAYLGSSANSLQNLYSSSYGQQPTSKSI